MTSGNRITYNVPKKGGTMVNVFKTIFSDFFIGILIIVLLSISILWGWFLPVMFLVFLLLVLIEKISIKKRMKEIDEKIKKSSEAKYIIIK